MPAAAGERSPVGTVPILRPSLAASAWVGVARLGSEKQKVSAFRDEHLDARHGLVDPEGGAAIRAGRYRDTRLPQPFVPDLVDFTGLIHRQGPWNGAGG